MIPDDFDWIYYLASHPDLVNAGIITEEQAKEHWLTYGNEEGRKYREDPDATLTHTSHTANHPEVNLSGCSGVLNSYCSQVEHPPTARIHEPLTSILPVSSYKKIYAIITYIGYPFGGGEAYLLETMRWMYEAGYHCVWFSFTRLNRENKEGIRVTDHGILYDLVGNATEIIDSLLDKICPTIVHTQGSYSDEIAKASLARHITTIVGYHFWIGLVNLDPVKYNTKIIDNIGCHSLDPACIELAEAGAIQYVASEFMNDVIGNFGYKIRNVIYPISEVRIVEYNPDSEYIVALDVSEGKGGHLILKMMRETRLPFIVVRVAAISPDLEEGFQDAVKLNPKSMFLNYQEDIASIYSMARIVLVTSLVDETFCRVAYEASVNGIPILTTGSGFVKRMVRDAPVIVNDDSWCSRLTELYHDRDLRLRISISLRDSVSHINSSEEKEKFMRLFNDKNVMILVPWCDIGLGVQSRTYSRILRDEGYKVGIFSFCPYDSTNKDFQADPSEWEECDYVYYSPHTREKITDDELVQFMERFAANVCLLPETCFFRVFEIAEWMRRHMIPCYAIPNIEIVRSSEIEKHKAFTKLLCPAHVCQDKLRTYGLKTEYIGHGVPDNTRDKRVRKTLKFLHVAGTNAVVRKKTLRVIEAFKEAKATNITLTVTVEKNIPQGIEELCQDPRITLITKHLGHSEILRLYQDSHVSIQVSSHEGIGIGFYESISCSTPVISLNTGPHNEVVIEGNTGWLIPCSPIPLTDNTEAIVTGSTFEIPDLMKKIEYLSRNLVEVNDMIVTTTRTFKSRFTESLLADRLLNAIF